MNWISIETRDDRKRRYRKVENGPFPISKEKFMEIREKIMAEKKKSTVLDSGWCTWARELLKEVKTLNDFDRLMLSNPICMDRIRVKEVDPDEDSGETNQF
jgi:hypothetical protein